MIPKPFATWTTYDGHAGIDFPQREGTPIPASGIGRVVFVGWNKHKPTGDSVSPGEKAGNTRIVDYGNGLRVRYCHLKNLTGPKFGDTVKLGDSVGPVGETGYATGPHLHMEVWVNGVIQKGKNFWDYVNKNQTVKPPTPAGGDAKPVEDDVIDIIERQIKQTKPQVIVGGADSVYLRLNDDQDVSVLKGAAKIVGGVVGLFGPHTGGPFDKGGYVPVVQLEVRAEKVVNNKVTGRRVGELVEWFVSAGNSYAQFVIPPVALAAGEFLRFRVAAHGVDRFTITQGSINLTTATTALVK